MTAGWSWYVIALVVLNIAGCVWLLWWTARRRPGDPKPEDTSHVWDGDLTEYNKPLPRWWINLFYLTIVFAIGYLVWYPGFGNFAGYGKWTSQVEHDRDAARATTTLEETFAPYKGQPIDVLARDPQAVKLGSSIFGNTCATCHGSSAKGAIGYPNLTDDVWHWGGSPEQVLQSVLDGREGVMPPWGKILEGMGGPDATDYVIAHVRALGETNGDARGDFAAARGKALYEGVCVACHGKDGKGNQALGAPDLTDDYWMYGDSREALREGIANGHHGIMPAHRALLGETRARLAAAYVWSLSHGSAATAGKSE
ncbi:MAG: cytochrome-c oxidase, cbb3-type subunit III [Thermomonas sp.]